MKSQNRNRFAFASSALALAAGTWAVVAGPLTPPAGPVASTYKTLTEVEPRTNVQSLAGTANTRHLITQPGSYYLSANVVGAAGFNGIVIGADNVTLDLNGFAVLGAAGSASGIQVSGTRSNITIKDGTVRGWGAGGIVASDDAGVIVSDVTASNNTGGYGIQLGNGAVVTGCTVSFNSLGGLRAAEGATVTGCTSADNTGDGFFISSAGASNALAGVLSGCTAARNSGNGFTSTNSSVVNCNASFNGANGFSVINAAVANCWARANTLSGFVGATTQFDSCATRSNGTHGFEVTEGALLRDCVARGNFGGDGINAAREVTILTCHLEDNGVGIRVTGVQCRVEGCTLASSTTGLIVTGTGNIIVGNRASVNTTNYNIAASNTVGTIVTGSAALNAATNSLVNVSY